VHVAQERLGDTLLGLQLFLPQHPPSSPTLRLCHLTCATPSYDGVFCASGTNRQTGRMLSK
jgi:hypothetical protein